MSKITFVEWLQEIMEKKRMSKADLAHESGISAAQITRITTGEQGPGIDTLVKIANALKVPPTEVFIMATGYTSIGVDKSPTDIAIEGLLAEANEDEKEEFLDFLEVRTKKRKHKEMDEKTLKHRSGRTIRPARSALKE